MILEINWIYPVGIIPPQIGATSHRAKRTKQWTKYNNLITITQSPKLSDMNPIEKVWNFEKLCSKKTEQQKKKQLKLYYSLGMKYLKK